MTPAESNDPTPLTPASRAIGEPTGVPVVLADGETWLLRRCGLAKELTALRDRLFDMTVAESKANVADVFAGAIFALGLNYRLSADDMRTLLAVAPQSISAAVTEAVIPIDPRGATFTEWARSVVYLAGHRPADVPPDDLPHLLEQMVRLERAVPFSEYTTAGVFARKKSKLMNIVAACKDRQEALAAE